ncbi:hypothetical protein MYSTI_06438 [Myxococcus stipitatus DSM 14675]|uniref:Beta-lactamase n=1 Tax=Myxococcus stipitatus (strain DSM 14675 / JCM 12634 / Mx s8) TaxID=1278073 RepID=L7UFJ0_MYXSD|nr:hypothetical protein [Myxococcus stipitatus]AGC47711.1 hypothetical protein MYSTI_06438 [Myxococcus stipitatus DSM 14675]
MNNGLVGMGLVLCAAVSVAQPVARDPEAARLTARSTRNACADVRPFYWEMGDAGGKVVGDSVGLLAPGAGSVMNIASASKWLYGAYVLEVRGGAPRLADIPFLNFTSTTPLLEPAEESDCKALLTTVHGCNLTRNITGPLVDYAPASPPRFVYQPGHLEAHADYAMNLGASGTLALASALESRLPLDLSYGNVNLAGGAKTSATEYARFLRGLMSGGLKLGAFLGTASVCASPACGDVGYSPWFSNEPVRYSLAHWVEQDQGPAHSGGFSSAGLFGFYPWVSKDKSTYLIVAREDMLGVVGQTATTPAEQTPSGKSILCGRLIREAYFTGRVQD